MLKLQSRRSLRHLCLAKIFTDRDTELPEVPQRTALFAFYMDPVSCSNVTALAMIYDRFIP